MGYHILVSLPIPSCWGTLQRHHDSLVVGKVEWTRFQLECVILETRQIFDLISLLRLIVALILVVWSSLGRRLTRRTVIKSVIIRLISVFVVCKAKTGQRFVVDWDWRCHCFWQPSAASLTDLTYLSDLVRTTTCCLLCKAKHSILVN